MALILARTEIEPGQGAEKRKSRAKARHLQKRRERQIPRFARDDTCRDSVEMSQEEGRAEARPYTERLPA
jgi:hypothetical protein